MIRLLLFVLFLAALTFGLSWFADRPGSLVLNWMGYEIETSFFVAFLAIAFLVGAALVGWSVIRQLVGSPAAVYRFFDTRRQKRGHEALSSGLIAISAGDKSQAVKYAGLARQALPNDPMTALLRAQTATLCGDRATARRIYASMIEAPDTELLGLRGLFLEAMHENETEAAKQFAERAMRRDPKLSWAVEALFDIQCKTGDWAGALSTLAVAKDQKHFDKADAKRKRAVLLTAQAIEAEDDDMDLALDLALDAHGLAPDLTPAAALAGRILASKGDTAHAAKVVSKSWKQSPQPDLAVVYAFARPGDTTRDRLKRVQQLAAMKPHNVEGPIAVAQAAIEAREFEVAREALKPLLRHEPTQRVCTLMARTEAGEFGDKGRVREWLARGLRAPRDPAWTADGHVSDHWQPISPVTGRLDAFQWKVPVEAMEAPQLDASLDELLALEEASSSVLIGEDAADDAAVTPPEKAIVESATAEEAEVTEASSSEKETETTDVSQSKEVVVAGSKSEAEAEESVAEGDSPEAPDDMVSEEANKPETVPKTGTRSTASRTSGGKGRAASEPRIFVSPRAPDDPGPEPLDPDEARTPLARFRMPASKGS